MINMNIIIVNTLILKLTTKGITASLQERVLTKPIEQILEIVVPMIHEEA